MNRRFLALLGSALLLAAMLPLPVAAAAPSGQFTEGGNFIVQMEGQPVVAYTGGVKGLKPTAPRAGQKIDPLSAKVVAYVDYLTGKQQAVLDAAGGKKLYNYVYAYNGFAARLTAAQANKMATLPDVLSVAADEKLTLDTSSTPDFLGLSKPGGLWDQLGGIGSAGDGVIIGIIDTGIWPESLSFADRMQNGVPSNSPTAKRAYQQVPGWNGRCVPGEQFTATNCNQKLIGARYYNAGWGGNAGIDDQMPWEFNSPRDFGGHGTHTSSTAGGNANVPATGAAAVFGAISGIAPRARIAAYKVCWETGAGGSCSTTDSVAAIDQAVADGVDVMNYSISGSTTNVRDAVEIAFMYAAAAGVFVAASAGNSGPASSTVAHPGPWLTTVAAGTHNRDGQGSVTLGNGVTYYGASVATPVGPAPLIDSVAAGLAGADPGDVELCVPGTLDPAAVSGKIVLCLRGVIARVDKSLAVKEAGGVGMVMYNNPDSSLNADFHFVPTVHVNAASGLAIKTYAADAGATATINQATIVYDAPAPFTASFSSRGPSRAAGGDLLKPDLIAPGQDILAAVAPPGNAGRDFDLYSGTSMSSPHVAGLAALLKDLHPTWSPMAIKSALMTTGTDVLDGPNTHPLVIFRQGAGHVAPNSAADPGLVFNSGWNDWLAFICAVQPQGLTRTCNALASLEYSKNASDFNSASIAIADLAGIETISRTVTNVSGATETYTASHTGLAGINVVLPAPITVAAGAKAKFDITFMTAGAALNAYTGGQLTLTGDQGHVVRIPMVVRPVALAAPAEVSASYDVVFGFNGPFTATARGLVPAALTSGTVMPDPDQTFNPADPAGTVAIPVTIGAGTTYARFELFDADVAPGSDIDLYVYRGSTLVGSSGGGTSAEQVNLVNPAAGTDYVVYVHGWGVVGSSPFKLHTWLLGSADAGNMTVTAPPAAVAGTSGTIGLAFPGLTSGRWLGSVAYSGAAGMPNPTIVRVDVP